LQCKVFLFSDVLILYKTGFLAETALTTTPFTYHEKELLIRLSQNDELAFKEIYLHFWRKLYALAFDKLQSRQCAEDVLQEVFTSLWLRRHGEMIQSLEAYLAASVKYSIFRQLAGKRKSPVVLLNPGIEIADEHRADLRFIQQMLDESVSRLPQKCKLVFNYSRTHGLSNKEIAGELAISEKSVEKHITKAIRYLRSTLTRCFLTAGTLFSEFIF
jgi:RNA polymerase sigma-70 factor (ECF subfamily)